MTQLADIISRDGLVPVLFARLVNGVAIRTNSVAGYTIPAGTIQIGLCLFVYAEALSPEVRALDGIRELNTSPVVKIEISGNSVILTTKNSTYMLVYGVNS